MTADLDALRGELARERWNARHDLLTGLLDRRGMQEHLVAADPSAALALIDLDHFHRFNRASGLTFSAGAAAIRTAGGWRAALARANEAVIRPKDAGRALVLTA